MAIPAGLNQQIKAWSQTATEYPREQTVHALFEQQVSATPDAIAVEYEGERLSYAELNARANCLAHYLRRRGVGAEVMVGLFLERGLELVVSLLGILKAGGAYVPLDLDYPQPRVTFMLEDAGVPVLLSLSSLSEQLPDFGGELVCLDTDWKTIERESAENPDAGAAAGNLAYVIYTSGSTGTPKGVEIPHRAINRLVRNTDYYQVDATDRIAQASNVSFDAATFEIWGALLNGAQLVGLDKEVLLDSKALAVFLEEQGITAMFLTTALFNQIAREAPGAFKGLRGLMFGGEAVDPGAVRQVLAQHPPARLLHVYGPTESTTFASWYQVEAVPADATTVPIGRPLANTRLYILDQSLNPVPVGVPGELYIGGDGLARGYLKRPELTAERFVPDPRDAQSRLYRTGDQVRYRRDGTIEYLGRFDHQVKLRGFRVELGEIEAALRSHYSVSDAVVTLTQDGSTGSRLVVYFVSDSGNGRHSASRQAILLREYLQQKLPHYMVPAAYVSMDALPLTPNGKVDRRALPAPDTYRSQMSTDYRPPLGRLENTLAAIWRQALKVERVGINDNFFELGGDSLSGAILINALQDEFGIKLYVVALFDAPTIAEQVTYLEKHFPDVFAGKTGAEQDPLSDQSGAKIDYHADAGAVGSGDIDNFRNMAAGWHRGDGKIEPWQRSDNPRVTCILTTARSGSSLFRIMLAGHPQLFVPPELELLSYDSLRQRRDRLSRGIDFMREGLVRAVMELKSCDAREAQRIIAEHETRGDSVRSFYCLLQEWIGERMLVDKSATYSMSPEALERVEQGCEDNLYIHLVRHPLGTIRSFEEARLDRVLKIRTRRKYSVRQYAELLWIVSHQNVLHFLAGVPQRRRVLIRFEELIKNPQPAMERICELLNIDFDPLMLEPYRLPERRMTDGINAQSVGMTDAKFHQHDGIDADVADAWRQGFEDYPLSEEAWRLAELLGYERPVRESNNAAAAVWPAVPQAGAGEADRLSDEEVDRRLQAMAAARRTS